MIIGLSFSLVIILSLALSLIIYFPGINPDHILYLKDLINVRTAIFQWIGPVGLFLLSGTLLKRGNQIWTVSPIKIVLVLLTAYFLITWGSDKNRFGEDWYATGSQYLSVLIILWQLRYSEEKFLRCIYWAIFFLFIMYCVVAVGQITGIFANNSPYRFTATFENSGDAANVIACAGVSTLHLLLPDSINRSDSSWRARMIVAILTGTLTLILLVLSEARIAIAAFLVGALTFTTLTYPAFFLKMKKQLNTAKLIVLIGGMSILMVFMSYALIQFKLDSARGRMLIWKVTTEMIAKEPISGNGPGSFKIEYNKAQAKYLANSVTSLSLFADNTYSAFNDMLELVAEWGIAGTLLWMTLWIYAGVAYNKLTVKTTQNYAAVAGIITFCICGMFSYPSNNSIILLITLINFSTCLRTEREYWKVALKRNNGRRFIVSVILLSIATTFIILNSRKMILLLEWRDIANTARKNDFPRVAAKYESLYAQLKGHGAFLYNYGAELALHKNYRKSQEILIESTNFYSSAEQYCFIGDNYVELNNYAEAIKAYKFASNMVPKKIYPRYRLAMLYNKLNRTDEATKIAMETLKLPSQLNSDYMGMISDLRNLIINNGNIK